MVHAYVIWKEDEGNDFSLEHAWHLLKDKPKWLQTMHINLFKKNKAFCFWELLIVI